MKQLSLSIALAVALNTSAIAQDKPSLIVQITVDGLRGDLLHRYMDSFGEGGFRRLTENGVWYTNAHHRHANTETIVGHTTLATGAHPSEHGMIGNAWFDRADGRLGYNIEDPDYALLPVSGFEGKVDQVDPSQAAAETNGRSPVNILVTTFGDELWKSNNGRSKIVGLSGKDRSAVAMAGHVGDAYWLSSSTGAFETSNYYHDAYPQWVIDWNSGRPADAMLGGQWELADPIGTYLLADNDDRSYETDLKGFGRTFPHTYGQPEDGLYYTQVLISPLGDRITADFAKAAIIGEELGQDSFTDFLGVSFAGVDGTQHFFGPSSLEAEEMVRQLDRTLAELLTFIDDQIDADRVLYVLSGDHGMPEMPEFMAEQGLAVARNDTDTLQADLNLMLTERFDILDGIRAFYRPYIYLDNEAISVEGLDRDEVIRAVVRQLENTAGIAVAMPAAPLPEQIGHTVEPLIRNNYHPLRSGDIYVAQAPYSFLYQAGPIAVMHGSPWNYDTHVPIIFAGDGIEAKRVSRSVATVDVAVTLADILGTTQPSGAAGEVLHEVVGN